MVTVTVVTVVVIVPFFMATIFPLLVTSIVSAILPPEALMVRSIVPRGWYVPFRPLHRHYDDCGQFIRHHHNWGLNLKSAHRATIGGSYMRNTPRKSG